MKKEITQVVKYYAVTIHCCNDYVGYAFGCRSLHKSKTAQ